MAVKRSASTNKGITIGDGDAFLIIDCINDLNFRNGEQVLPWAAKLAPQLLDVRTTAHKKGIPVIYTNDNFGLWSHDFNAVYKHCTQKNALGRNFSKKLKPTAKDYLILKPRHSAFFATCLIALLEDLKIKRLILSGIATNLCVLFTAHDAHMHQYSLVVLSDCCAAESDFDHNIALQQLEKFCKASICRSTELLFKK